MRVSTLLTLASASVNVCQSFQLSSNVSFDQQQIHDKRETTAPVTIFSSSASELLSLGLPAFPYTLQTATFRATGSSLAITVLGRQDVPLAYFEYDDFSLVALGDTTNNNLIINPGFETNSLPPWVDSGTGGTGRYIIGGSATGTPAHSGLNALAIYSPGSLSGITQTVTTVPNTIYTLTFYISNSALVAIGTTALAQVSALGIQTVPTGLALTAATDSGTSQIDGITNIATPTITGLAPPGQVVTVLLDNESLGHLNLGTTTASADGIFNFPVPADTLSSTGVYFFTAQAALPVTGALSAVSNFLSVTYISVGTVPTLTATQIPGGTSLVLSGTGDANTLISFFEDGSTTSIGQVEILADGTYTYTTSALASGSHSFLASEGLDAAGNQRISTTLTITIVPVAPTLSASVGESLTTTSTTFDFVGTGVTGNTIQLYEDGAAIGGPITVVAGQFSTAVSNLIPGIHTFTATTNDGVSDSAQSSPLIVTINPTAPTGLALSADTSSGGAGSTTTYYDPVEIIGSALVGSTITLMQNGNTLGSAITDGNGQFDVFTASLPPGTYTVTAIAQIAGTTSDPSDPFTFTIINVPAPIISGFTAASNTINDNDTGTTSPTPRFFGTAVTNSLVTLFDVTDPNNMQSISGGYYVDSDGEFEIRSNTLSVGTHLIVAQATVYNDGIQIRTTSKLTSRDATSAFSNVFTIIILAPPSVVQSTGSCTLLGCYRKPSGQGNQALSASSVIDQNDMSVEFCATFCFGYKYFGVQNQAQCYCGNTIAPGTNKMVPGNCQQTCTGNPSEFCGGFGYIDLYQCTLPSSSSAVASSTISSQSSSIPSFSSTAASSTILSQSSSSFDAVSSSSTAVLSSSDAVSSSTAVLSSSDALSSSSFSFADPSSSTAVLSSSTAVLSSSDTVSSSSFSFAVPSSSDIASSSSFSALSSISSSDSASSSFVATVSTLSTSDPSASGSFTLPTFSPTDSSVATSSSMITPTFSTDQPISTSIQLSDSLTTFSASTSFAATSPLSLSLPSSSVSAPQTDSSSFTVELSSSVSSADSTVLSLSEPTSTVSAPQTDSSIFSADTSTTSISPSMSISSVISDSSTSIVVLPSSLSSTDTFSAASGSSLPAVASSTTTLASFSFESTSIFLSTPSGVSTDSSFPSSTLTSGASVSPSSSGAVSSSNPTSSFSSDSITTLQTTVRSTIIVSISSDSSSELSGTSQASASTASGSISSNSLTVASASIPALSSTSAFTGTSSVITSASLLLSSSTGAASSSISTSGTALSSVSTSATALSSVSSSGATSSPTSTTLGSVSSVSSTAISVSFSSSSFLPASSASTTSRRISTSSSAPVSQATGFLVFSASVALTIGIPRKRQEISLGYLTLNADGTVSGTTSCNLASIFAVGIDGRLTSGGLNAFADTADLTNGLSPLTFGTEDPLNVETTFSFNLAGLQWTNAAFTGSQAIFAFPPTAPLLLNAIYDGTLPVGYTQLEIGFLAPGSSAAIAAGCAALSSTAINPSLTSSMGLSSASVGASTNVLSSVLNSASSSTQSFSTTATAFITSSPLSPTGSVSASASGLTSGFVSVSVVSYITSTIYTTTTYAITSCDPTVKYCPYGSMTTAAIEYTTICPAHETTPPQMTTSTVYGTTVYTITSCPPTVYNCPVGHKTTETIALYTTVCPVEEAKPTGQGYPAGGSGSDGTSYSVGSSQSGGQNYEPAQQVGQGYPEGSGTSEGQNSPADSSTSDGGSSPAGAGQAGSQSYAVGSSGSGTPSSQGTQGSSEGSAQSGAGSQPAASGVESGTSQSGGGSHPAANGQQGSQSYPAGPNQSGGQSSAVQSAQLGGEGYLTKTIVQSISYPSAVASSLAGGKVGGTAVPTSNSYLQASSTSQVGISTIVVLLSAIFGLMLLL